MKSLFLMILLFASPPLVARADVVVSSSQKQEQPAELQKLMSVKGSSEKQQKKRVQTTRIKVLESTARTLGFQRGFAYRYNQIQQAIDARSHEYDRIYNFAPLLIDNRVLPPVIHWADKAVNIESNDYATTVEASYRIVEPARIVSAPPSWRGYLQMENEELKASEDIFPATTDEQASWRASVEKGWGEGMTHADEVFEANTARLLSDYRGILRFKMLADRGLVNVPVLAEGNLGVQVGKDVLNIDQKTFRITVPAEFRAAEVREARKK
jgi:defect-in-organelle-trafficking protein DotC